VVAELNAFLSADSSGPPGVLAAYQSEIEAEMASLAFTPDLNISPNNSILTAVILLLSKCLPQTKPADIIRYLLTRKDGNTHEPLPSLTELGLDSRRAQLLAIGLLAISSTLIPAGLLLLKSTTLSSLLSLIKAQRAHQAAASNVLEDTQLTAELKKHMLNALLETEQEPTADNHRPFPPFADLHSMHHDRLHLAKTLQGLITKHVLLIGATGFLGGYLLNKILAAEPWVCVHCLVRAPDEKWAVARLKQCQKRGETDSTDWQRVQVVVGDVRKPMLGMPLEAYARLSGLCDTIYVALAAQESTCTYEEARQTHVIGLRNILFFATTHHRKTVNYVSCIGTLTDDLFTKGWAVTQMVHKADAESRFVDLNGKERVWSYASGIIAALNWKILLLSLNPFGQVSSRRFLPVKGCWQLSLKTSICVS